MKHHSPNVMYQLLTKPSIRDFSSQDTPAGLSKSSHMVEQKWRILWNNICWYLWSVSACSHGECQRLAGHSTRAASHWAAKKKLWVNMAVSICLFLSLSLSVCLSHTYRDSTPLENKVWEFYFYIQVLWLFFLCTCSSFISSLYQHGYITQAGDVYCIMLWRSVRGFLHGPGNFTRMYPQL